jgi:EAL domain-containing protein (putative c-di-GMP-specific phosphodiesterase class I)
MATSGDRCALPLGLTLEPVFHPILFLRTQSVKGYEALSRPRDAAGQPLSPDELFRRAEQEGFAAALDRLAIAQRAEEGLPPSARLFVNVSPTTLLECPHALEPLFPLAERVVLEVTERRPVAPHEASPLLARLGELRAQGFTVALDDLGEGYASLEWLLSLEPSFLKLGMSLVRNVDTDRRRWALVRSLVDFARRTGVVLVAEGIETQAAYATLRDMGVPLGQGFLFARPTPQFSPLP